MENLERWSCQQLGLTQAGARRKLATFLASGKNICLLKWSKFRNYIVEMGIVSYNGHQYQPNQNKTPSSKATTRASSQAEEEQSA